VVVALLFSGLLGAIIGSFLNVVIHRLPRGESLATPGSRCPACETPLKPYDNVPVVSWLVLRGRCRACGEPISPRYPLIEFLTAAVFVAVAAARGADPELALELPFAAMLIAVAGIDLEHRIVPNKILLPAAIWAIAGAAVIRTGDLPELLIAGAAAFVVLLLAALAYPAGMGMGDVKLVGVMGLYLGYAVAPAMFAGFLAGSLVGLGMLARHGSAARKMGVPFAPFLALGGLLGLLVGPELIDLYSDHFVS
jgi:leader peptidase (prepilin peptidase) / N-methyltransferase